MIDHARAGSPDIDLDTGPGGGCDPVEPALGEIVEELTRRLESGEPLDAEEHIRRNPVHARPIRQLLPALKAMIALGRSLARHRRGLDAIRSSEMP
jgi:hypothetical protein